MALELGTPGQVPVLTLACARDPGELVVTLPGFTRVGSEERLTLGVGPEAHALVAQDVEAAEPGVVGKGAIHLSLLDSLVAPGAVISASYGTQTLTRPAPRGDTLHRFVDICRSFKGA